MIQPLSSPVIFAHRGASSHAPENTLAAFHLAVDQGAKAIELDVQLTKDNQVVVFHDQLLDRTTNGTGRVKSHTLAEIKRFNAGVCFNPAFQTETIPTLAEAIESIPEDILINIELKNLPSPANDLPIRTISIVQDLNAQARVLISSFNTLALLKSYRSSPSISLGLLVRTPMFAKFHLRLPYLLEKVRSVHLSFKYLTPEMVTRFKQSGKKVFTYTLNHTSDILNALNMGIDGFFTDDPGFARRIINQKGFYEQ